VGGVVVIGGETVNEDAVEAVADEGVRHFVPPSRCIVTNEALIGPFPRSGTPQTPQTPTA
jgi:hypothetical protein